MKKFVVIPAYNEAQTIYDVVTDIKKAYGDEYTIVVVDDASLDSTGSEARRAGARVITHTINRHQGAGLVTGTEYALRQGADIVIHVDADGQHDVSNISRLAEPIEAGRVGVVLGSRFLKVMNEDTDVRYRDLGFVHKILKVVMALLTRAPYPLLRRVMISGNLVVNSILTGVSLTDAHNGLRALSRYAATKITILQDGMAHATEYVQEIRLHDLTYQEIPAHIHYGLTEKKSQGFFHGLQILRKIFVGRFIR